MVMTMASQVTWIDPFEADLPGELVDVDTFGTWEPDPEPPAACALCGEDGADPESGICRICADRLPKAGGCGLALWLVAGLTSGVSGPALDHLADCPDCRAFFDRLGDLARAADMEADTATPHAELLTVAA